jgi:hypothetical protein
MSLFISRRENYYVNVKLKNINAVNVERISLLYKKEKMQHAKNVNNIKKRERKVEK